MPTILLNNTEIEYQLKKSSRSKRIRISIDRLGFVVVTIPKSALANRAERFLSEKSDWVLRKLSKHSKDYKNTHPDISTQDPAHYKKYKEVARLLVIEKVKHWNTFYQFPFSQIRIKNTTSRWGSCSSKKNLNFNYKIFFLPEEQQDYLIIHELCHLKQMNHSKDFWKLVAEAMPNYRTHEKDLKKWVL